MAFVLKEYQKNALAALEAYLEAARVDGPAAAFAVVRGPGGGLAYKSVEGMESTPYVCLRLPTGGGKTVLASHAVAIAGRAFLEQEYPVVLWLVPTNTIREQTLDALRNSLAHHYLHNSSLSGTEISFLLGFEDPNSFVRAFQTWTGSTPQAVRVAHAKGISP